MIEEDLRLFRSANQYSILFMSYGMQFVTDTRFKKGPDGE
jgi:hypothetical protein